MGEREGTIKDQIREMVLEALLLKGVTAVADDESLLKNGVLDSLGMYRLIEFLEEQFAVKIEDSEMVPENFESINQLDRFVTGRLPRNKQQQPEVAGRA
jgi:acyl carrier protein